MVNAWLQLWERTWNWRSIPQIPCYSHESPAYFWAMLSHCIPFLINLCLLHFSLCSHNSSQIKKKSFQPSTSALEPPQQWYWFSWEHGRDQHHAYLWRTGSSPRGHAGPAQQCQWDGVHSVPGHSRLCPGPLAGSGAPKPQGQEWWLCRWPPLFHLSTRAWRAGSSQSCYLPWHQWFSPGERKQLKTVGIRAGTCFDFLFMIFSKQKF